MAGAIKSPDPALRQADQALLKVSGLVFKWLSYDYSQWWYRGHDASCNSLPVPRKTCPTLAFQVVLRVCVLRETVATMSIIAADRLKTEGETTCRYGM